MTAPNIDMYFEHENSCGWKHSILDLDEHISKFVILKDCKANETSVITIIKPLPTTKIAIVGKEQGSTEHKPSDFAIELCDNRNNEISPTTKILIRKVKRVVYEPDDIVDEVIRLDRPVYEMVSMKNKLDERNNTSYHKFYNFKQGVEFNSDKEEWLEIVAVNPDRDIDSKNTRLMLKCYQLEEKSKNQEMT